jgi:cytochrome b561
MIEGTDMNATRSTDIARSARERPERFPMVLIVLHWLIAICIIAMLGIGLYMVGLPRGQPFKAVLINFHKSLGLTIFLLVLMRIGVVMVSGRPPLPPMRAWQRAAASATQVLLYAAMIAMPVTGYLGSSFNTYGTRFWGLLLPKWGWDDKDLRHFWFTIHEITAWIFIALIALHVAGALKHQLIDRDGLLRRMLP